MCTNKSFKKKTLFFKWYRGGEAEKSNSDKLCNDTGEETEDVWIFSRFNLLQTHIQRKQNGKKS